ncbi:hypothetical protein Trco_003309 [Trichoderma cornu-damae]|uniref:Uncharacterized protein n=1 Tax=Trichoderma cornu-damae TaxID=654480 RepID=A0A9P8QVC6_9HYPO|nr:hypothetical protein Trco_003309 [Trichoderma cornu-damae]
MSLPFDIPYCTVGGSGPNASNHNSNGRERKEEEKREKEEEEEEEEEEEDEKKKKSCIVNRCHQQVNIAKQWAAIKAQPSPGMAKAFPLLLMLGGR